VRTLPRTGTAAGVMFGIAAQELVFIVGALCVSALLSFMLTPVAIRLAQRAGAIDEPDSQRRIHRLAVPRGGGLAVAAAFIAVGVGATLLNGVSQSVPQGTVGFQTLAVLFIGVALAAVFGYIDDRWQIRARWQAVSQLILAAITIAAGVTISFIYNPLGFLGDAFGGDELLFGSQGTFGDLGGVLAIVITTIWIVGMINSINFIDGLDGLSTGIALIASVALGLLSIWQQQPLVGLFCGVLAGALAGFLPWNFHPARVFTGTTGVMAVGYALAVLSILGTAKVAVALLVLGVPIIDTFWIIIRRLSSRQSPFTPDRGHFHHRLLDLGLTHRSAVLVIYGICIALAILSLVLSGTGLLYAFMGIVVGGGLVLYLLTRKGQYALDARSYPEEEPGRDDAAAQETDRRISGRTVAELPIDERRRHGTRPVR
jgi:UDP-GlcNAc:undecaprenyl-phosphate/decaprenyl-phosphate GlcNAc-1-phosphate transferase